MTIMADKAVGATSISFLSRISDKSMACLRPRFPDLSIHRPMDQTLNTTRAGKVKAQLASQDWSISQFALP